MPLSAPPKKTGVKMIVVMVLALVAGLFLVERFVDLPLRAQSSGIYNPLSTLRQNRADVRKDRIESARKKRLEKAAVTTDLTQRVPFGVRPAPRTRTRVRRLVPKIEEVKETLCRVRGKPTVCTPQTRK